MKSGYTRNKKLKTKARIASEILRKRREAFDKALVEAQKAEKKLNKYNFQSDNAENRAIPKRTKCGSALRYIAVAVICLSLILTILASYTVSWFMMTMDAPGASISTGHISLVMRSYKKGSTYNLNRYVNSEISGTNSVELYNGLQQEIGLFADSSGNVDDVYFVIEKKEDSIDLETYLGFTIESASGSGTVSNYIGGFMFQLENVTDVVEGKNEITTTVIDKITNTAVAESNVSSIEKKLHSFIQSNQTNTALPRAMSFIMTDSGTNTATDLVDGNVCVYRLTTYLSEQARESALYQNVSFNLKVSLKAGQSGAMTGGNNESYLVSNMSEVNDAISKANPGDSIVLNSSLTYNGDLVITAPIKLLLNGNTLTINGNLVCTSSYSGHFEIDTSTVGSLLAVKKVGIYGGNIDIDAPECSCSFKGQNSSHNADIACAGDITINCNCPSSNEYNTTENDKGLTIDGARICTIENGSVVQSTMKGVILKNDTRVNITEGTKVKSLTAANGAELVSIINLGEIDVINLSQMNVLYDSTTSEYCQVMHVPQIYIDNFGTVSSAIVLPTNARKYYPATFVGNTRIISEFGSSELHVTGSLYFFDSHIESVNNNVVDVYGDGSFLKVYYTDFNLTDGVDIDIDTIFSGSDIYPDIYPGYFTETGRSVQTVTNVQIITGADKSLTAADYLYIKNNLIYLVSLNLSEASTQNGLVPDSAFNGLATLSNLTLPSATTTLGRAIVANTQVFDLYLPVGIATAGVDSSALVGVKYVHPQNTNEAITNLLDGGDKYIFVPNSTMLSQYRNAYGNKLQYIFKEATLSQNGLFFYRKLSATTMDLAVWVGTADETEDVSLDYMSADGSNYYIVTVDDYAFYGKLTSANKALTCSNKLVSIGDYAFFGCNAIKAIDIQSPVLTSIGYRAFGDCTGLETAKIDGVSGMSVQLNDQASYLPSLNPVIGNFSGCSTLTSLTLNHVDSITSKTLFLDQEILLPLTSLVIDASNSVAEYAFYVNAADNPHGSNTLVKLNVNNVGSIGNYAFREARYLKYAVLRNTPVFGAEVFAYCTELTAVSAPETVSIGLRLFEGCTALEVAKLSSLNGFTNLTSTTSTTNVNTFYGCTSLKYLETGMPEVDYTTNFLDSNISLHTWIIHIENNVSADGFPGNYLPQSVGNSCVILLSDPIASIIPSRLKDNVSNLGTVSADDLVWADHDDDKVLRWSLTVGGETLYLSDFGMGDYVLSKTTTVATVYRCLLEKITGDTTMPNVAPGGGTTTIGEKAFQYLAATPTTTTSDTQTIFRMPDSVTRIEKQGFTRCEILGVEGNGVTFLGQSAFERSINLRWAKFDNCNSLGFREEQHKTISGTTYYFHELTTFAYCIKLQVVEIGVVQRSYFDNLVGTEYTHNFSSLFFNCSNLSTVIIHTENTTVGAVFARNIFGAAYRTPTTYVATTAPAYNIVVSEKSNTATNYYNSTPWGDNEKPRLISTGTVLANDYLYAADNNPTTITRTFNTSDGWTLGDIGYGDYICTAIEDGAKLIATNLYQDTIVGQTGSSYVTPDSTVDGAPIISIGAKAFKTVSFTQSCNIRIADSTRFIDDLAFVGTNSVASVSGSAKSIGKIDLNLVSTLGDWVFAGLNNLTTVTAGENIRDLGSYTFAASTTNLTTIRLETENHVVADNIFNGATPNTVLKVYVYSNVYLGYYQGLGFWGGPNGSQSSTNAVSTQLNLSGQACFATIGLSYSANGFRYYYTEYTDILSGVAGYQITSITIIDPAQRSIGIPSALPDSSNAFKPVLSLANGSFADLYAQNCLATTLELPMYLQTIDVGMLKQLWPALQEYRIATSYSYSGLGRVIGLQVNFSTVDGVLYSADGLALISCPPGKNGTLTISNSSNLNTVSIYAFYNTHLTNVNLDSVHNYIVISNDAFVSSSTLRKITVNKGAVFMDASINSVSGLTEIRLPSTTYRSQFVGALFQNMTGSTAQILVPQSMMSQYAYAISTDPTLAQRLDDIANYNP